MLEHNLYTMIINLLIQRLRILIRLYKKLIKNQIILWNSRQNNYVWITNNNKNNQIN